MLQIFCGVQSIFTFQNKCGAIKKTITFTELTFSSDIFICKARPW